MERVSFFHDSCIKEMHYLSGAYVNENMDKVQEYTIMSVPTVVIDGEVAFIGAPSTEELVEKLKEKL